MRKTIINMLKKAGEKTAEVPADIRSWPIDWHQPKMPKSLQDKMLKK